MAWFDALFSRKRYSVSSPKNWFIFESLCIYENFWGKPGFLKINHPLKGSGDFTWHIFLVSKNNIFSTFNIGILGFWHFTMTLEVEKRGRFSSSLDNSKFKTSTWKSHVSNSTASRCAKLQMSWILAPTGGLSSPFQSFIIIHV